MNAHHKDLLRQLRKAAQPKPKGVSIAGYLGTTHARYHIRTAGIVKISKDWTRENKEIKTSKLVSVLSSLYKGKSYEEKMIASRILGLMPKQRAEMDLENLDKWLNQLEGWAEIDGLCQNNFEAEEVLSRWKDWQMLLKQFNRDENIVKRRASLVLLVKPTRQVGDKRLAKIAFKNIDKVTAETEVLITKAVSWLLRSMLVHHRGAVESYVKQNEDYLPKIAVRETKTKLETGKK